MTANSPLLVAIDPQIFWIQRRGGVSRYFADLARELHLRPDIDLVLPFKHTRNDHLAATFPGRFNHLSESSRLSPRALGLLDRRSARTARGADIIHHTWYLPRAIESFPATRRICTIHDMIPEEFPEIYAARDPHQGKREHVDAADAIVCNSEATKSDLLRHWGDLGKPVHVTPLAVAENFFTPRLPEIPLPDRYVLFVGRRGGYKNFSLLAQAFEQLSARHHDLHLVCVGGGPFSSAEVESLEERSLTGRVHRVDVSEHDLPGVYSHAICFVFPSVYEGFGLPILEAFASGTPVIISDTASLVEVAGGFATVVSPTDPEALVPAVEQILTDSPAHRTRTVVASRERARQFTWRRTCEVTVEVYRIAMSR